MTDREAFMAAFAAATEAAPPAALASVPAAVEPAASAAPAAPAPAPTPAAQAPAPAHAEAAPVAPDAVDELLSELAEQRAVPTDPRLAFREQAAARLQAERGLPEALARALANSAPKRDLEAWLAPPAAVGFTPPASGQAAAPLPPAAPAAGQPAGSGDPTQALLQRLQALEQQVVGQEIAKNRAEFTAAAKDLVGTFPLLLTPDGRLDSRVAQAAKALLSSPAFAGQPARSVLQAAGAAVFTGLAPSSVPTQTPQTPVATGTAGTAPTLSTQDQFVQFVQIAQGEQRSDGRMTAADWQRVQEKFARIVGRS